jgi:type I restriction enzyme, R subunit
MARIGLPERATQNRVITLFKKELGYRYLGDWHERQGNSNIEEALLGDYLQKAGYSPPQIAKALYTLRTEANNANRNLYENNKAVYNLLRYGIPVKLEASQNTETVWLINWQQPENNDFALAEEVTLRGNNQRRPDIVLYLNGIAIAVLELKNSRVSIGEAIRQNISNQSSEFNAWFFSTIQLVLAGNDSEGLQYGTIGTEEKAFLQWKEDETDNSSYKLDKYLLKICDKARIVELLHDFVVFDAGLKKLPRVHQYFGIKAAQTRVLAGQDGIIWHTQGSGKSIVMVLLAQWILENNPQARVVIVTDRDELDKQIEGVFRDSQTTIARARSGAELMDLLAQPSPRLLCSLVHKFGRQGIDNFEGFIEQLAAQPSQAVGQIFVFVDECHRTQGGKLHRTMKALMPGAVFIGFTGTPLLKKDRQTSLEVFGSYIHTYKYSEAVEDKVVLDLVYEARDIDQLLGSPTRVDAWFDAKTRGLNNWQKDELKKKWGTMQKVLSSRSRMERVVEDISFDFATKPRLVSQRGNAILVASSIYEACKYFSLFQRSDLRGQCAIVTSYNPQAGDVSREDTGASSETDKQFIYNTYTELLRNTEAAPGGNKTSSYEDQAKRRFRNEPATMKLLIVVDKLLTGFDAPSCSYLYIDKTMQDHGLFQAICRTNRLDGEDKDFGYIVDYKDLFKKVENAIAVYSTELDFGPGSVDPTVLLHDRLTKGRERLETALEALALLYEAVEPPQSDKEFINYFCGNSEIASDLAERQPQRVMLYKAVVALLRAYGNIADELPAAGYSLAEIKRIETKLNEVVKTREIIRLVSGEVLDLKPYESDMRHLIDTYIEAQAARKISPFDGLSLLALIAKIGLENALNTLPAALTASPDAVAETIENNVRSRIFKDQLSDPAYFEAMSALLNEIIADRKAKAIEYEVYLQRAVALALQVEAGQANGTPTSLYSPGMRALYNNLAQNEALALRLDTTIRQVRPDNWRGNQARQNAIKAALYGVLNNTNEVERVFAIIVEHQEY